MGAAETMAGRTVARPWEAGRNVDSAIKKALEAEVSRLAWAATAPVSVFVRDRRVLLCGCVADADLRDAVLAAATRVPEVRSVKDHLLVIESAPRIAFASEGN